MRSIGEVADELIELREFKQKVQEAMRRSRCCKCPKCHVVCMGFHSKCEECGADINDCSDRYFDYADMLANLFPEKSDEELEEWIKELNLEAKK